MAAKDEAISEVTAWLGPRRRPAYRSALTLARRQPLMAIGTVIVVVATLAAILAPFVGLPDPAEINVTQMYDPPSMSHPLGTDQIGRDQLSRVMYGARVSLSIAFFGVLLGSLAGAVTGLISGYFRGTVDAIIQRFVEIILSIPGIVLAFVLVALMEPGLTTITLAIAVVNLGNSARVIRGATITTRGFEFITAARSIGARWPRILALHVAPATVAPFLVIFSAQVGFGILTEATLGFLGVGIPPPTPSWGAMVAEPFTISRTPPWWLAVFPGLSVALAVLAFNMVGDGMRDELDPRLRGGN